MTNESSNKLYIELKQGLSEVKDKVNGISQLRTKKVDIKNTPKSPKKS